MSRLGILTSEFPAASLDDAVAALVGCGVFSAQLQLGSALPSIPMRHALQDGLDAVGDSITGDLADVVRSTFRAHGVELSAVDGTYNMCHPDRARRMKNLDRLHRLVDLTPRMGSTLVTLCTGSRNEIMWVRDSANHDDDAWRDLLEQMRAAARFAEAAGVTLAFEPEHSNIVDSASWARRLLDEVASPALKVLFDPANIFHRGDLARMRDHLEEAVAAVGPDIALVHAKDLSRDGAAGGRPAGRGVLDYTLFLELMQRCDYDGAIVLHGLHGLTAAEIVQSLDFVRGHAPPGYVD